MEEAATTRATSPIRHNGGSMDMIEARHVDDAPRTTGLDAPATCERNAMRQAERRLVVYLDATQRRWLRGVEASALRDDVRLSVSAIVRLAIDELRTRGVSWHDLAERLATLEGDVLD